jgi:hypothetical protein
MCRITRRRRIRRVLGVEGCGRIALHPRSQFDSTGLILLRLVDWVLYPVQGYMCHMYSCTGTLIEYFYGC